MSRLDELIAELCPNGVEFSPLSSVCVRQKGIPITAGQMKKLHNATGDICIFAGGNTKAFVNESDIQKNMIIHKPSIIIKSRGNIGFEYYDKPFTHKNELWSYSKRTNLIDLKFIYYYLESHSNDFQLKAKPGKLPQISIPDTDNYRVPIPPLLVQQEIIRILDKFTKLIKILTQELTKRKQQYQYYLHLLLSKEYNMLNRSVLSIALGEIGKVCMCRRIMKNETSATGDVPFYKIGTFGKTPDAYISREKFEEFKKLYSFPRKGEVLISASGTIGRTVIYNGEDAYFQDSNIVWLENNEKIVLNKYLY